MTENQKKGNKVLAAALIAVGLLALGLCLRSGIVKFKSMDNVVTVKGLSEQQVPADKAIWRVSFGRQGNDLSSLYSSVDANAKTVKDFIKQAGITDDEIFEASPSVSNLEYQYRYSNNKPAYKWQINQSMTISTKKVDAIRNLVKTLTSEMLKKDIIISDWASYDFTGLNDLKPEMIKEATAKAREAAQQFADNCGSSLGKIKTASQGQFSIEDLDETTDYIKKVRVVTSVTYYLK